jgi:hypothetical protein
MARADEAVAPYGFTTQHMSPAHDPINDHPMARADEAMASSGFTTQHITRELEELPSQLLDMLPAMVQGMCPESLNGRMCAAALLESGRFCPAVHICHVYKQHAIEGKVPCTQAASHWTTETRTGEVGPKR